MVKNQRERLCACVYAWLYFFCYNVAPMYRECVIFFFLFYHTHLTEGDADAVAIKVV